MIVAWRTRNKKMHLPSRCKKCNCLAFCHILPQDSTSHLVDRCLAVILLCDSLGLPYFPPVNHRMIVAWRTRNKKMHLPSRCKKCNCSAFCHILPQDSTSHLVDRCLAVILLCDSLGLPYFPPVNHCMIVADDDNNNRHGGNEDDDGGGGIGSNNEDSSDIGNGNDKDNKSNNQLKAAEEGRQQQR
jgi:hypothetical protein